MGPRQNWERKNVNNCRFFSQASICNLMYPLKTMYAPLMVYLPLIHNLGAVVRPAPSYKLQRIMFLFKVSSQRCTSNISCVLCVTTMPMSCVRRRVRNTWVASLPAGRLVLTQRGDGGPPWNWLPPNRTATLPIAPPGNQVFIVVCIIAWFPSSSCSCQCPSSTSNCHTTQII